MNGMDMIEALGTGLSALGGFISWAWMLTPGWLRFLLGFLGAVYLFWIVLYLTQRQILYFTDPTRKDPADEGLERTREVEITTPDGETLVSWHAEAVDPALPYILYLHGNRRALWRRAGFFQKFNQAGWGLSALAHRGFNGSTGQPSEIKNVEDAILAFDTLVSQGIAPQRVVVYGESLGSGTAVQVAAARPVGGLILHAPYDSFRDIVRSRTIWLLPRAIFRERYDSIRQIPNVKAPVLWIHGDRDRVIPLGRGRRLYDAATSPKYAALVKGANHFSIYSQQVFDQHIRFFAEACARQPEASPEASEDATP